MTYFSALRVGGTLSFAFCISVIAADRDAIAQQDQEWMIKATKEHELLKKDVGTWDATVKVWPMEGAQAMESKGTEKNELLPGGMWLITRFEGEVIGLPFVGVGTFGYDPQEKKYIGTWSDTMTPYLMITRSEYNDASKTLEGVAETRDAMSGEKYSVKVISRFIDDDSRVMEMQRTGENGKDWKVMEIQYKRKK